MKNHINKVKRNFENDLAAKAKRNPKTIWNSIKAKSKTREGIWDFRLNPNDKKSRKKDNDVEKVEILASFFSNVFKKEPQGELPDIKDRDLTVRMSELYISTEDTEKVLKRVKVAWYGQRSSTATKRKQRRSVFRFRFFLTHRLGSRRFRKNGKSAIFKKGEKIQAWNYRPVSLTSIVYKVMESLVKEHIIRHMKINSLFSDKQIGVSMLVFYKN